MQKSLSARIAMPANDETTILGHFIQFGYLIMKTHTYQKSLKENIRSGFLCVKILPYSYKL